MDQENQIPELPSEEEARRTFSDGNFWTKLADHASSAGKNVVHKALELYFLLRAPGTPVSVKVAIIVALAYFILPLDAIPDVFPGIGYLDDLVVLTSTSAAVGAHITPEIQERAKAKAEELFG